MRRVFLLILAVILLFGGAYLLLGVALHPSIYGLIRGAGMGLILAALGGFLLWDDFLKPRDRAPR